MRGRDSDRDPHVWRADPGRPTKVDEPACPATESFARGLPEALGEAVAGFAPYDPDVLARGVARGRHIRRRRRRDAFAVCVVATVLVGGAVWIEAGPDPIRIYEPGPALATAPVIGGATGEVSGADMVAALTAVLPAGVVSGAVGTGTRSGGERGAAREPRILAQDPGVSALYHAEHGGLTGVSVVLSYPVPDTPVDRESECTPDVDPRDECTRTGRADGGTVTTKRGFTLSFERAGMDEGQREWTVYYDRPDGGRVVVSVTGGGASKSTTEPVTPTLDVSTMTAMAQNPVWDRMLHALPAPEQQTVGVLSRLLRNTGVAMSDPTGAGNEGGVLLRDAQGATTLHVNVQSSNGNRGVVPVCGTEETDCVREMLPDGTRLLTVRRALPDAGGTRWRVAAARPDGLVVYVEEVNRDQTERTPGRPEPLLSIAWLHDIALSSFWAA